MRSMTKRKSKREIVVRSTTTRETKERRKEKSMSNEKGPMPVPKFSGERDAFQLWWTKFRAFATVKKFVLALASGGESDMPATESEALDTTTADGKRMSQAKERNAVGMAFLLMAFEKEADVSLAYKTMTNDWPGGRCYMVVELLLKK